MPTHLATLDDLPRLRAQLEAAGRVAVDTEFHAERRYLPKLLLVQVHVPQGETWVLDPLVQGLLSGIGEALRSVTWIVHGGQQDMRLLLDALGGLPPEILDTQIGAGLLRSDFPAGYGTLVADLLGVRIDKGATLSDWSRRPLSRDQLEYATRDAELLVPLWDRIEQLLAERGRLAACREACAEARERVVAPLADDELWRDLTGLGHLAPADAAVAQELVAWREAVAREGDQPARSVLSDGLVLDLARRRPATVEAMLENRRFPRAVAKRYGKELTAAIARAAARPEWGWPRYVARGSKEALVLEFLTLWAELHGRTEELSPRLVLPRDVLEQLALSPAADEAQVSTVLGRWRAELVAAPIARALRGESTILLKDGEPRLQSRDARSEA